MGMKHLRLLQACTAVLSVVVLAMVNPVMAQSSVTLHGYGRAMLSGIPGDAPVGSLPTTFYLYVEVPPGSRVATKWVRLRGVFYGCRLQKVATPVTVDSDPVVPTGKKVVLVDRTANDAAVLSPCARDAPRWREAQQIPR